MGLAALRMPATIVAGGFIFFLAAVLLVTGLAYFNADRAPALPWFPFVALPVLFIAVWQIDRRWHIGLAVPPGTRWGALAAFAATSMTAAHCVLVLEGAAHGITREFEAPPPGVTPFFAEVYWIAVVIGMSTASEVAFRGIMQARLTPLLGFWPGLLVPLVVNTLSHRWDGLPERAVGPWNHAAMGAGELMAVAAVGLVALAASVWIARAITAAPYPTTRSCPGRELA